MGISRPNFSTKSKLSSNIKPTQCRSYSPILPRFKSKVIRVANTTYSSNECTAQGSENPNNHENLTPVVINPASRPSDIPPEKSDNLEVAPSLKTCIRPYLSASSAWSSLRYVSSLGSLFLTDSAIR